MNKPLLIIICDFLLISLLSLARFDQQAPAEPDESELTEVDEVQGAQDMMEALEFGHERIKKVIGIQIKLRELLGKEKVEVEEPKVDETLKSKIHAQAASGLNDAMQIAGKHERSDAIKKIKNDQKNTI